MNETTLRNEIARRAPHLRVLTVGLLFGGKDLDAIVEDRRGQYLWSAYSRELDPAPIAMPIASGQQTMF